MSRTSCGSSSESCAPEPFISRRRLGVWLATSLWGASVVHPRSSLAAEAASAVGAPSSPDAPLPAVARITPRPLEFPADFGSHPAHRTEWWYMTGWLQDRADAAGTRLYGFQITFFRTRTGLPSGASRFDPSQLIFAHAAVTDVSAARMRHDQRAARAGFGIEAAEGDTRLALRDWRMERLVLRSGSRYLVQAESETARFALALQADATQPLLLQGDAGYSRKGAGDDQASHYYSEPQLTVTGQVTLDGRPFEAHGHAWLDHEWSDALLADGAVGWDWIGMNLDDGSALTAFRLRRKDGGTSYAGGSFRSRNGELRKFGPTEVSFQPGRSWKSAASGAVYPVEWTIATPAGHFEVRALLDNQEQDSRGSTGSYYWEGVSDLYRVAGPAAPDSEPAHDRDRDDRDPAQARSREHGVSSRRMGLRTRVGRGYLEMTGYSADMSL